MFGRSPSTAIVRRLFFLPVGGFARDGLLDLQEGLVADGAEGGLQFVDLARFGLQLRWEIYEF